jgi:hypothetical protein
MHEQSRGLQAMPPRIYTHVWDSHTQQWLPCWSWDFCRPIRHQQIYHKEKTQMSFASHLTILFAMFWSLATIFYKAQVTFLETDTRQPALAKQLDNTHKCLTQTHETWGKKVPTFWRHFLCSKKDLITSHTTNRKCGNCSSTESHCQEIQSSTPPDIVPPKGLHITLWNTG